MKASNTRRPLYQQTAPEQKGPFFSKANDDAKKKDDVFFQTKLAVNEPGDKHEQEADQVADKVMRKVEEQEKPDVQKKSKEDEKQTPGAAPVKKEEKKPGEGSTATTGKEEEKKKISKKEEEQKPDIRKKEQKDEEKPVQKKESKEEEQPVQKKSEGDKKEDDKTKVSKKEEPGMPDKEEPVMKKETGGAHAAHKVSLEERIKKSKGKGQTLPDDVRAFLEAQLGADLGEVVIHTDSEAIAMNKELNALAFTNGFDIYFNAGQYKPDTAAGQKLLAHELTHVLQQTGVSKKKKNKK